MKLLHKPFWSISFKKIRKFKIQTIKECDMWYTTYHLVKMWFLSNLRYFREMYLKHCDNSKNYGGHFFDENLTCLRCKKPRWQIDLEKRLGIMFTKNEFEIYKKRIQENCYLPFDEVKKMLIKIRRNE